MTVREVYSSLRLSRNPFPPTPDAGSFFFISRLEENLAEIAHCIEARKGIVLLTGEVGLGKSTLVRRLLNVLQDRRCHSALVFNTFLQDGALLSSIVADFGLPVADSMEKNMASLTEFLIAGHRADEIKLLIIDDAQNLSVSSLELIRLLSNLETDQEKLLQIMLVGQPELEQALAKPELRQLKSRIVKHTRLSGIKKEELPRYFDFRVNAAGAEGRLSIAPEAINILYRVTRGNLRHIHLILDRCLYGLATTQTSVVTAELVRHAIDDVSAAGEGVTASAPKISRRWLRVAAGVFAGLLVVSGLLALGFGYLENALPLSRHEPVAATGVAPAGQFAVPKSSDTPVTPALAAASVGPSEVSGPENSPVITPEQPPVSLEPQFTREVCERQMKQLASAHDVVHVQSIPDYLSETFKPSARLCLFSEGQKLFGAWLVHEEGQQIVLAQQAMQKIQDKLKDLQLLDPQIPSTGYFGPKTREALSRLQEKNGMQPTGQLDELTLLLLESQDEHRH